MVDLPRGRAPAIVQAFCILNTSILLASIHFKGSALLVPRSKILERESRNLESVSRTLESVSRTLESVSRALKSVSRT